MISLDFFHTFRARDDVDEFDEVDDFPEQEQPDAISIREQETRATLKLIHKWISRLPPEQIDAYDNL